MFSSWQAVFAQFDIKVQSDCGRSTEAASPTRMLECFTFRWRLEKVRVFTLSLWKVIYQIRKLNRFGRFLIIVLNLKHLGNRFSSHSPLAAAEAARTSALGAGQLRHLGDPAAGDRSVQPAGGQPGGSEEGGERS